MHQPNLLLQVLYQVHLIFLLLMLLEFYYQNLKKNYSELTDISNAQQAEDAINQCRNTLREEHIANIENDSYNYQTGVYYMDVISELERIGDFIINISQAEETVL